MNVLRSLNREFIPYEFKLGYCAVEATKNICCAKSEDEVEISLELQEHQRSSKLS